VSEIFFVWSLLLWKVLNQPYQLLASAEGFKRKTFTPYAGFATTDDNHTLIEPEASQGMATTNATTTTNIVLVHGFWADGSGWAKEIPVLKNAGHRVIAVQLPLHSLAGDVDTVKRAIIAILRRLSDLFRGLVPVL
jgi:pimeloyl-ACP methyl ester carboxylesterase